MFENFGINVSNILKLSEEERYNLRHPYVGTEHLLLAILKSDEELISFFKKYNLTYESFKKELLSIVGSASESSELVLYTPLLKRVINNALENAKETNDGVVTSKELVISLLEECEGIAIRIIVGMNIDVDKIYNELSKNSKITNKKLEIYETGILLNEKIEMDEVVIGRDKEINHIIETLLRKKKNNPLLIGDAGVGKTAIVEELVRRIINKDVPESLMNYKVVSLEMGSLVAGTKYRGEFEEKLTKIIKEIEESENIIIFIDEIHSMVNAGGAEGAITAGDILKPALARGSIKVIGATTKEEYQKYFSSDKALMRRFETIEVLEPNKYETKDILDKIKKEYERHHNVHISESVIDKIILYTDLFIKNKKNPDKAIDFLDSVCAKVKISNNRNIKIKNLYKELLKIKKNKEQALKNGNYENAINLYQKESDIVKKLENVSFNKKYSIKEKDILEVLEDKTNLVFTKEKLKFLDKIKDDINKELFGVEDNTNEIINTIKSNLLNKNGFIKICLEGEEYLGKSTICNLIGEKFPKCNYLKIDLNEYTSSTDINKLIGTNPGYVGYNDKYIFSDLKNNNFSIILFDHYNKCHNKIKDLIKEILKSGYITDNKGEKIYFNNSLVLITNDLEHKNNIGFNNKNIRLNDDLNNLVDKKIIFNKLTLDTLKSFLEIKNINNIDEIIKLCDYENYNYKNVLNNNFIGN